MEDKFIKKIEKKESPEVKENKIETKETELDSEQVADDSLENYTDWLGESVAQPEDDSPKTNLISPIISKKMEYFLNIAEEQGLAAAIKAVEKENDPLLLDALHDALAKEKLFLQYLDKNKK